MFKKETEYALRGLIYIENQNQQGRRPGVQEIAEEIEAPSSFTAKILQKMVRHGFLSSMKGIGGGFFFLESQRDIALKEIILVTEGDRTFHGCGFGLKSCNAQNPCPLHDQYAPIRDAMNRLVSTETIRSLAYKSE